ncbi:polyketide antibiotic transporter [Arthrobacter sp. zg-Y1219]|uniref:ABC transporter permease n=1 Tax=Arthrobacter sp. zg-Y1219 TaxID=3049067 RepID=UPI0024C28AD6|nr:polyketide antibiotic transporter [Arthrobacter sp. zg-Y1219]MDK1360835.1 polyketide antibiotic transporter [Arthrobacter sp. zg-Y1219]
MSTAAAVSRPAAVERRSSAPWAATGGLLRLNLRLDRIRILVWTLAVGLAVAGSMASFEVTYNTPEALQARAGLMANPAAVMMTGPAFGLENYTFGAMVANELSLYLFLASAIMSILLVVRHTRAEEESGRMEMLRALPVGSFAPAAAAVLTVAVANAAVGAATIAALAGSQLETASSVALGVGTALTGLVFAGVAAVSAQLTEHARSATGTAMAVLAAAFLIRGIGDVINNQGSWLSWFSPLAWAQQARFYVDLRWEPLALAAVATVLLLALAVYLAQRRDLGAGLRQPHPGPAAAPRTLLSPAGLASRLLRGSFAAWAAGVFLFAAASGALANSLEDAFADVPELGNLIAVDLADMTTSFASALLSFLMVAPLIFSVSGVLRLRGEEDAGRVEQLLVTGSSRPGLLIRWLGVVAVQTILLTAVGGFGTGTGVWAGTGDADWAGKLTLAALAYLPAVALGAAIAVALYGLAPQILPLAWAPVVWAAVVLYLGSLLGLPDWATDLSPLAHVPLLPSAEMVAEPLVLMGLFAAVLAVAGLVGFRRRDVGAS